MQMMMELQRQQADASRENARASAETARDSAKLASEQPRQMVEMLEKIRSSSGNDQLLNNVAQAYGGAWDMNQRMMEMMMQGQGSPWMNLAEGTIAQGKEVLEGFISSKRDQELAKQQVEATRVAS